MRSLSLVAFVPFACFLFGSCHDGGKPAAEAEPLTPIESLRRLGVDPMPTPRLDVRLAQRARLRRAAPRVRGAMAGRHGRCRGAPLTMSTSDGVAELRRAKCEEVSGDASVPLY